ncbi:MAG: hypothetical protein ACREIE_07360, partial [Nitrospiraceae bacterium]
ARPSTELGTVSLSNGRVRPASLLILVLEPRRQANRKPLSLLSHSMSTDGRTPVGAWVHMFMQWVKRAGWIARA